MKMEISGKIKKQVTYRMIVLIAFILILQISFISSAYSSYYRSSPQYTTQFGGSLGTGGDFISHREYCEAGQDFVVQIAPFGCTPAVVRSDLLEEQNVPVFCELTATQINPLMDVKAIESISFSGKYPKEVSGVGFHPAKAALGIREGRLNSLVLENIGYAVIVLKKQKNESAMPEFVQGNLTAKLRYDIEDAYGVGKATFYLPDLEDSVWEDRKEQYGFWNGKGYLKAEGIGSDGATIGVYDDLRKIETVDLGEGETSEIIYLPGFDCLAGMRLRLDDLSAPNTRARIRANGEVFEVSEGERFLENKCIVQRVENDGLVQRVYGECSTDDKRGEKFDLKIKPSVMLKIGDKEERRYVVGDKLYEEKESNSGTGRNVFLAYIGKKKDGTLFIVPMVTTHKDKDDFLNSIDPAAAKLYISLLEMTQEGGLLQKSVNSVLFGASMYVQLANTISRGSDVGFIIEENQPRQAEFVFAKIKENAQKKAANTASRASEWSLIKTILDKTGIEFESIRENSQKQEIQLIGLAGAADKWNLDNIDINNEVESNVIINLEKAMTDYNDIINYYSGEKEEENDKKTYGERALLNEIKLLNDVGQKRAMLDLCELFKEEYPESIEDLLPECSSEIKLANTESASDSFSINGQVEILNFEGVYEPDFEEYGAEISVSGASDSEVNRNYKLRKDDRVILSYSNKGIESFELKKVGDDYVEVYVEVNQGAVGEWVWEKKTYKIKLGEFSSNLGENGYRLKLNKVNLKEQAKVSVIPTVDNAGTEVSFSFKIGIDKRGIQLSPEKTKRKIDSLKEQIEKWEDRSEKLGKVVKGFKGACLGVGTGLMIKNFFANTGGKAIARKQVMRGEGGWNDKCADMVAAGSYKSQEECFFDKENAKQIDKDVDEIFGLMKNQNTNFKNLQEGITKKNLFGERVVDDSALVDKYLTNEYKSNLESNIRNKLNSIKVGNKDVQVSEIINSLDKESWEESHFSIEQLKALEINSQLLNSDSEVLRAMAEENLKKDLGDIYTNSKLDKQRNDYAEEIGVEAVDVNFIIDKESEAYPYKGKTYADIKEESSLSLNGVGDNVPVAVLITSNGKEYVAVLKQSGNKYVIDGLYDSSGDPSEDSLNIYFVEYDSSTYEGNGFDNPEIKYFETEPYKGMPALVPFDTVNGWYAATKQTIPVLGKIRAFDESGRVTSLVLCNVGENKRAQYHSGIGDDICEVINLGTGQPFNQFSGLTKKETTKLVDCAVDAIRQASSAYKSGAKRVRIKTACSSGGKTYFNVGKPAADIPEMACTDFMSPSDCNLMFNVCDPVVCPSSRCDFGGEYPVRDVIQSGIIGSAALCLPNFREGIKVPVCLTGIKAGIDSWLSVLTAHRDCLQTSLDTGETVGICDEIYSIHACEFFWRQSLPLAKIAIPKIMEFATGQNVHGGGEYLGVQSAWENAEESVDYFTQYYAENSFKAFQARTAEEVGEDALCQGFASVTYPEGGNILDALTDPDSPPQFHGRFDEIPFTTATNPPISQYKVFYHIYAGKDSRAYYQVYLRSSAEGSYYQDTSNRRIVDSGFIPKGEYASETRDFTAPSGYKEMCIVVNGQEECGFKQVSTSFALNYIKDEFVKEQAEQTNIKTEKDCVAGTPSVYSLLTPNLQGAAEEALSPSIYNRGIIRICATGNPGKGTDSKANMNGSRWVDVGYCDNQKMRCWLDTESVKDAVEFDKTAGDVLENVNEKYQDILKEEGYLTSDQVDEEMVKIDKEDGGDEKKIEELTNLLEKVLYNRDKAKLLFKRAEIYEEITREAYKIWLEKQKEKITKKPSEEKEQGQEELEKMCEEIDVEGMNLQEKRECCEKIWDKGSCDTASDKVLTELLKKEQLLNIEGEEIVFEFQDGTSKRNMYYMFDKGKWKWSVDSGNWMTADEFIVRGGLDHGKELSDNEKKFVSILNGRSYKSGLNLLMKEVVGTVNTALSTDKVRYSYKLENIDGIETYSDWFFILGEGLKLRYYDNGWEFNKAPNYYWVKVSKGVSSKMKPLHQELLENLANKNFYDGAIIIFNLNLESGLTDIEKEVVRKADDCTDCGEGVWKNVCTEEECIAISEKLTFVNCRYEDVKYKLGGKCDLIEVKNGRKDEDYDFKDRNQAELIGRINAADKKIININCANYAGLVSVIHEKYNIPDPLLIIAIMMQESSCNKDAGVSSGGAVGLMQITESSFKYYCQSISTDFDEMFTSVQKNIECGAKILRSKYDNVPAGGKIFNGCNAKNIRYYEWEAAVRGYNGWGCGKDENGFPIFEQDNYVEEVMKKYIELSGVKIAPLEDSFYLFDEGEKRKIINVFGTTEQYTHIYLRGNKIKYEYRVTEGFLGYDPTIGDVRNDVLYFKNLEEDEINNWGKKLDGSKIGSDGNLILNGDK